MPTNDFLPWATAGGANVMSQPDYVAAASRLSGVTSGTAKSALANKSWRQGATMAAALGQFINEYGNLDALDDGSIANLVRDLARTLQAAPWAYVAATGTANAWLVAPTPALAAYAIGRPISIVAPATNSSTTVNANISGLGNRRIKKSDGTDPEIGDLIGGRIYSTIDDGTNIRILNTLLSDLVSSAQWVEWNTAGSFTWVATVTGVVTVTVIGAAGGAGGTAEDSAAASAAGAAGGRAIKRIAVTKGTSYPLVVGAGGARGVAGTTPTNGSAGGSSSFGGGTITANGGSGGGASANGTQTGALTTPPGGSASGGDVNETGRAGGLPAQVATGTYLLANGGAGFTQVPADIRIASVAATGIDGVQLNGGQGSYFGRNGGKGGDGRVRIEW